MGTRPGASVHLFVVPGYADWEPAHAVAELRREGGYAVEIVGFTREPVTSMGGVTVLPTRQLSEVRPEEVAAFILPGGDRWETDPVEPELLDALRRFVARGVPIAAICAATTVLARAGLLRDRRHTSNGRRYLAGQVPDYGEESYVDAPAVRDKGVITASGLADVEFAALLMEELGVGTEEYRRAWLEWFRGGRLPAEA